jgi:hypothetical protein
MYHGYLMEFLGQRGDVGNDFTLEVCQKRYEVCLADYTRFLAGWGGWYDIKANVSSQGKY